MVVYTSHYTLLLVSMNSLVWRWSWWLLWTWPEWHPFPSWGFCLWSQLYLGSIWVSPMQPQCSWAKKKEVHWRSVHKMGTWYWNYCCGTRRLMINNQSVKSSAGHCVCVCNLVAAWHDFLGQRYLACSYVLPHWHASYEHDNDAQNCLLSPKMIISHWKMGLKIFEVNVQIRGYLCAKHTSATLQDFCCHNSWTGRLQPKDLAAQSRKSWSCWLGERCWR